MNSFIKNTGLTIICFLIMSFFLSAQDNKDDENLNTRERSVSPFSKIHVDGVFNVYLSQGDKENVKVEANDDMQHKIIVKVDDGTLIVDMKDAVKSKPFKKINIYITLKDIAELVINGVGNVKSSGELKLKSLNLEFTGVGNTDLELTAGKLNAKSSAVGNISLKGVISEVDLDNDGVGSVKAFDLKTEKLLLQCSGTGTTEVYADKEISIDVSGVGNVYYKGNAVVKKLNASGIGRVKKV